MKEVKVAIEGLKELLAVLKGLPDVVQDVAELQLAIAALDLQGKAQQLAPVDTGDLRGSAFTITSGRGNISVDTKADEHPESARMDLPTAGKLEAYVGFSEPYALRQHEDMGANHPKRKGKYGVAKYLEIPYKANIDKYIKGISKAIKEAVEN